MKDNLPITHSEGRNYGSFSKCLTEEKGEKKSKDRPLPDRFDNNDTFSLCGKPTPLSWAGTQSHPGCRVQQPVGVDDDLRSERCQLDQALPRIVPKNNIDGRQLELIIDQEEVSSRASYSPCRQQNGCLSTFRNAAFVKRFCHPANYWCRQNCVQMEGQKRQILAGV